MACSLKASEVASHPSDTNVMLIHCICRALEWSHMSLLHVSCSTSEQMKSNECSMVDLTYSNLKSIYNQFILIIYCVGLFMFFLL